MAGNKSDLLFKIFLAVLFYCLVFAGGHHLRSVSPAWEQPRRSLYQRGNWLPTDRHFSPKAPPLAAWRSPHKLRSARRVFKSATLVDPRLGTQIRLHHTLSGRFRNTGISSHLIPKLSQWYVDKFVVRVEQRQKLNVTNRAIDLYYVEAIFSPSQRVLIQYC